MRVNSAPPIALVPFNSTTTTYSSAQTSQTPARSPGASSSPTTTAGNPTTGPQSATILASYSTSAAGKSYSASVEETAGTYVASVEVPPEASASGSSVQSAETNLNARIDTLV